MTKTVLTIDDFKKNEKESEEPKSKADRLLIFHDHVNYIIKQFFFLPKILVSLLETFAS